MSESRAKQPLSRLRSVIAAKGTTQAELAERTGISAQYINDICNGRRKGHRQAQVLAEALGCDVADLTGEVTS